MKGVGKGAGTSGKIVKADAWAGMATPLCAPWLEHADKAEALRTRVADARTVKGDIDAVKRDDQRGKLLWIGFLAALATGGVMFVLLWLSYWTLVEP
jgi:hypothetical protein